MNGRTQFKVLIVDQNIAEVETLIRALKQNHHTVLFESDVDKVLPLIANEAPHILVVEMRLINGTGLELFTALRQHAMLQEMCFIICAKEQDLQERIRIIESGVDDFIGKPYYPAEVVARIESLLQEIEVKRLGKYPNEHGFNGNLQEMNLVDLIQTMEIGKKSGIIEMIRGAREGQVFIHSGQVVDAYIEGLDAEDALSNMLTWLQGSFQVRLLPVQRKPAIREKTKDILTRGTKLIHRWRQAEGQMPSLMTFFQAKVMDDLASFDDLERDILTQFKEAMSILEALDYLGGDQVLVLEKMKGLYERSLLLAQDQHTLDSDAVNSWRMRRLKHRQERSGNYYSRIAAFFKSPAEQTDPEKTAGKTISVSFDKSPQHTLPRITPKPLLSKAELLLIRQKLISG